MIQNYNSGEDYANAIIETLKTSIEEDLPEVLLDYWCEELYELAINSYNDYIVGKKEVYLLTEEEATKAYEKAGLKYTQFIVDGLVDKDLVQAGISPDGEILYSLTEKGKQYPF